MSSKEFLNKLKENQSSINQVIFELLNSDNPNKNIVFKENLDLIISLSNSKKLINFINNRNTLNDSYIMNCMLEKINDILLKMENFDSMHALLNDFKYIVDEKVIWQAIDYKKLLNTKKKDLLSSFIFFLKYSSLKEEYTKFQDYVFENCLLNFNLIKDILEPMYDGDESIVYIFNKYHEYLEKYVNNTQDNYLEILMGIKDLCYEEAILSTPACKFLKNRINNDPVKIYKKFFINNISEFKRHADNLTVEEDSFCEIAALVIKENVEEEKIDYSDITYHVNPTSIIINVNNKFIKVSSHYKTFNTVKIPYMLQALMRREFEINNKKRYIEVTPKVDTNNITSEETYQLYKKIRQMGLNWTDAARRNAGRLLDDNVIKFSKPLNPTYQTLGYKEELNPETILKAGDLVILDNDYIFYEDDPKLKWGCSEAQLYENRYQKEIYEQSNSQVKSM